VDHACRPNANVVFKGRTAELRAMEPLADFATCRISYLHEMLPTSSRQKVLQEQYYFTCDCRLCSGDPSADMPLAFGLLLCTGCQGSVPYRESKICAKCGRRVKDTSVAQLEDILHRVEEASSEEDFLKLYAVSEAVAYPWDVTRIQLAERAMRTALDQGDIERFYAIGLALRSNYEAFFHANSLSLGLYNAKMAKAAFFLGELKAGSEFLKKALVTCKLTYGESHPFFSYLLHLGPATCA
jgi:SET and MYND domain-containing protein